MDLPMRLVIVDVMPEEARQQAIADIEQGEARGCVAVAVN